MSTLAAIGFFAVIGLSGAVTGFVAGLPRARQGAMLALGSAALALLTAVVGNAVGVVLVHGAVDHLARAERDSLLSTATAVTERNTYAGAAAAFFLALAGVLALRRASSLARTAATK